METGTSTCQPPPGRTGETRVVGTRTGRGVVDLRDRPFTDDATAPRRVSLVGGGMEDDEGVTLWTHRRRGPCPGGARQESFIR